MTDLKPCPFCGSEAHIVCMDGPGRWTTNLFVQCSNNGCGASVGGVYHAARGWPKFSDPFVLAAMMWNRRAGEVGADEA